MSAHENNLPHDWLNLLTSIAGNAESLPALMELVYLCEDEPLRRLLWTAARLPEDRQVALADALERGEIELASHSQA